MLIAYENGAHAHVRIDDEVYVLAAPAIHVDGEGRLHSEDKPALEWPCTKLWMLENVFVPKYVATSPEQITAEGIDAERNVEVRRLMIQRYGYDRYISKCKIVHRDDTGILRSGSDERGRRIGLVEVINGSCEPDGTRKTYFLKVPPECQTACEAVAWTYGMTVDEYRNLSIRT